MLDDEEEIVAVIYHETDGAWHPHSIHTRTPRREWVAGVPRSERPRLPGYYGEDYDAAYSRADRTVYVHNSGGGGDGNDRSELAAMGYALLDELPGDPFADTEEGDTTWCDACEDDIVDNDTFVCAVCHERGHEHGVGHLFVVVDAEEAHVEAGPGLYRVKDADWRLDSMFYTSIYDHAVERIGPVPEVADTEGYPCAEICDACRDKLIEAKDGQG